MSQKYEFQIVRIFNAPIEKVWDAWADGETMKQWSCPDGFVSTVAESDFREGGSYRFGMKSDFYEGVVFGVYQEIKKPSRLVMTHSWEDVADDPLFQTIVTVELIAQADGKTKMIFTQSGFHNQKRADSHQEGWAECIDKLERLFN